MSNSAPITIEQVIRYFRGLPHQMAALPLLDKDLMENGYDIAMRRDREWFRVWSQSGKQT